MEGPKVDRIFIFGLRCCGEKRVRYYTSLKDTIFYLVCVLQDRTPALPAQAGLRITLAVLCPVPKRAGDEVYTSMCNYKLCKPREYTTKLDS